MRFWSPSPCAPIQSARTRRTVRRLGLEHLEDRCVPDATVIDAVGSGPGIAPQVKVYQASNGVLLTSFAPYGASFLGGVRVAVGDVNGDGQADVVTAPGPGGGPHVRVFDGAALLTGQVSELRGFFAYAVTFTGGVNVAVGDVNGDGKADIITGADAGGGPHVQAFSGADGSVLRSFFAYTTTFTGGVRVAAADVNGDGKADIITGPGAGGGPHVEVFSGANGAVLQSFFAYDPTFTGGIFVAGGDVNGDGKADIVTAPGQGGWSQVRVFNGTNDQIISSFFAYGTSFQGGVRVAVRDVNNDGLADIITGAGVNGGPHVEVWDGFWAVRDFEMHGIESGSARESYLAFDPSFLGGIYVG
jgi:hypothetical protein